MKRRELQAALGLSHEEHFRNAYLLPAIEAGLIEMTIPDKPRSSKQRYRLTDRGRKFVADPPGSATPQVTPQVVAVLEAAQREISATELQAAAALKDRVYFLKRYLEPMLAAGWLERTIPDKPRSRNQKYRLTDKGREWLEQHK